MDLSLLSFDLQELIGKNVVEIRDEKAKVEHNRYFRCVMDDIGEINNINFCICEECRFRTKTYYCECCGKDFCEECEVMRSEIDGYYCSRCEAESEEESD